jgi:hypothetical protein
MTLPPTTLRRVAALAAATVAATTVLLAPAGAAQAAPLGTLALNPTSGPVTASPMFASATTSAACPANYGQNAALKLGRVGGVPSNLARLGSLGTYSAAPFTLSPTKTMAVTLGTAPTDGEYVVFVECLGVDPFGAHPDKFVAEVTVAGDTWRVKGSGPVATATATTLVAAPAGPVTAGTDVSLTATVTPATAAGSVQFRRGTTQLGTVPVSGGVATLIAKDLPAGSNAITAVFTPTDPAAFAASTSAAVTVQVTAAGAVDAGQQVTVPVTQGVFTLVVPSSGVTLAGGTIGGQATGELGKATVTDLRGTNAGWDLTGQVENFTAGTATIAAAQLGWAPQSVTRLQGSGSAAAGGAAAVGSGLAQPKTLCKAAAKASSGVFECGAKLTLGIPDTAAAGSYTATLTLTLA